MNNNVQIKHPEVLRIVAQANMDMLDYIIEDMVNGDQGKGRSKYKSAVQYLNGVKTRYQLEVDKACSQAEYNIAKAEYDRREAARQMYVCTGSAGGGFGSSYYNIDKGFPLSAFDEIPGKDVLRKGKCVPTQTEGNGFIRKFLMEFVAFFFGIAGLVSIFILIWAVMG